MEHTSIITPRMWYEIDDSWYVYLREEPTAMSNHKTF